MSESVKLYSFPSDSSEALAMLYLNNLDLSAKTPEEIVHIYLDAFEKITNEFDRICEENSKETDAYLSTNQ